MFSFANLDVKGNLYEDPMILETMISYAGPVTIVATRKWTRDNMCFIQFDLEINGVAKKIMQWMTKKINGEQTIDNVSEIKMAHLIALLKLDQRKIFEIPDKEKDNWYDIPAIKGQVGAIIEVKPAFACKPNDNGDQYPELILRDFFNHTTGQTWKEYSENLPPEAVAKELERLLKKEYKEYKEKTKKSSDDDSEHYNDVPGGNKRNNDYSFQNPTDITDDDLPY